MGTAPDTCGLPVLLPSPCALDNTTTVTMTTLLPLCDSVVVIVIVTTLITLILTCLMTQYPMGTPTAGGCRYGYGYGYGYGSPGAVPVRKPVPTYQVWVFAG